MARKKPGSIEDLSCSRRRHLYADAETAFKAYFIQKDRKEKAGSKEDIRTHIRRTANTTKKLSALLAELEQNEGRLIYFGVIEPGLNDPVFELLEKLELLKQRG